MSGYLVVRKGSLFVAYLAGMTGLIVVTAMLGETVACQVVTSVDPSWGKRNGLSSRVETGLVIQARAASWQPDDQAVAVPEPVEPMLSASALALGIDRAERAERETDATRESITAQAFGADVIVGPVRLSEPVTSPLVSQGPAVAGWSRRVAVRKAVSKDNPYNESTARIIERSLRAEI